jgi:hypothetical protein
VAIEHEPSEDTLQALRRMESSGDNLNRPRDIDFSVVFETEECAKRYAEIIQERGYKVELEDAFEDDPIWDVTVTVDMIPTARDITDFEIWLEELARPLDGQIDGWGAFSNPNI